MKNSYFYGVLSFGRELKKKEKRKKKKKINEKGLLKKTWKKRTKMMKDNIPWDEKRRWCLISDRVMNKNKRMKKKREEERGWKKKNEEDEVLSAMSVIFNIRFYRWNFWWNIKLISLKILLVISFMKSS